MGDEEELRNLLFKKRRVRAPAPPPQPSIDIVHRQSILQLQQQLVTAQEEIRFLKEQLRVQQVCNQSEPVVMDDVAPGAVVTPDNHLPPLVYMDVHEFMNMRQDIVQARVDMLASLPLPVAHVRLQEVAARQLTDFEVETALIKKKTALEEKYVEEGLHPDVYTPKVQLGVLQLFRILHKRRIAVLQGYKLPPVKSLFAQLP